MGAWQGQTAACKDIGGGIELVLDSSIRWPLRFDQDQDGACLNYHPNYLTNLANALGYAKFNLVTALPGNGCPTVWLDSNGAFQQGAADGNLGEVYDVQFTN
jgi:hypothetical protein